MRAAATRGDAGGRWRRGLIQREGEGERERNQRIKKEKKRCKSNENNKRNIIKNSTV